VHSTLTPSEYQLGQHDGVMHAFSGTAIEKLGKDQGVLPSNAASSVQPVGGGPVIYGSDREGTAGMPH